MNTTAARLALLASLATALVLVGCGGPPKPVKSPLTMIAAAVVNPDPSGRASPVVVRLYQLKSDVAFNNAEFFALFDDEKKVLAADLVARDEFELAPGEHRSIDLMLPPEVRFFGAIGAFRDIRNSTWRGIVPVSKKGLKKAKVTVDKTGIRIEQGS